MELCAEGSLESHVKRHGCLSEALARCLCMQLLEGVAYLHGKRIVHRDVKPENLLLTDRSLSLKLTDFNSAKRIGGGSGSSAMLTDRGTQDYSAPELRFGWLWNERVDEWACGMCLYFMLRAMLPFQITKTATAEALRAGELPHISWEGGASTQSGSEDGGCISELMRNLLLQCLTINIHDRPPVMELLMHPVFNPSVHRMSTPRRSAGRPGASSDTAKNGPHHKVDGAPLAAAAAQEPSSATALTNLQRSCSLQIPGEAQQQAAEGWIEGRDGRDTLGRLAQGRCVKTMTRDRAGVSGTEPRTVEEGAEVPLTPEPTSPVSGSCANRMGSDVKASKGTQGAPRWRRHFTTHGGAQITEGPPEH